MLIYRSIYFSLLLFLFACNSKEEKSHQKHQNKKIYLYKNVFVVIPEEENNFNDSITYSNIELWIDSVEVYSDTSNTEYMFDDSIWPQARKLINGEYEILLPIFDAPDLNKIKALYFKNRKLVQEKIFPYFEYLPKDYDDDGKLEYYGIINIIDAYENPDSCYYNPTIYYEITERGFVLDSVLSKQKIIELWGGFYGYKQSDKIILPCK